MNDTMNTNYNDLLDVDLNIIVMNDAGKLIFNRNTNEINEEDLCSMCGLIQAVRMNGLTENKTRLIFIPCQLLLNYFICTYFSLFTFWYSDIW